ncbi:zinc finger protein 395b [Amia ocellicauda]|uniref:zinc finger protein 395b n=1 Tax=Amia ocellicauda TaxID=2972642 RepID=UPI003464E74A
MALVLPMRLGKRSPLGTLVCAPCPSGDGILVPGQIEAMQSESGGAANSYTVALEDGRRQDYPRDSIVGPGFQTLSHFKLYPGQKVFVSCCGQECAGVVEQHNHVDNEVSVFLPALAQHTLRKIEDVWLMSSSPEPSQPRRVSSSIAVPKSYKSPEAVDMDEIMAAMVLTSLSCSPVVQSTSQKDMPNRGGAVPAAAGAMECGELSDSGSSGYWSWDRGNGSPAPSPPIAEDGQQATPTDEGLDMELEHVLFDDPTPRKRKNSMKVVYKCLWPNCGKILTSVVGIKRHIRTLHLRHSTDLERSRREEDFYYTEVSREAETASPCSPRLPSPASPPCPVQHSSTGPGTRLAELPASEAQQPSPLSQSAPSSFWQVRSEHSYQASPPVQVAPSPASPTLFSWTPAPAITQSTQVAPFRSRSVSVGEQWLQQHSAPCRSHPAGSGSPPRGHCTSRKARGEAKKCRKVYGIEHRDQWCTACRWKKACQRFLD